MDLPGGDSGFNNYTAIPELRLTRRLERAGSRRSIVESVTLALGAVQRKPGRQRISALPKTEKGKASLLPHSALQFTVERLALDFFGF